MFNVSPNKFRNSKKLFKKLATKFIPPEVKQSLCNSQFPAVKDNSKVATRT